MFYYSGGFLVVKTFNNLRKKRLTILTYHRIAGNDDIQEESLPYLFVSRSMFASQMKFVRKWYKPISFEVLDGMTRNGNIPSNSLIVTFDDGYEDNYSFAFPILERIGIQATLFLTTGRIGQGGKSQFWWDRMHHLLSDLSKREDDRKQIELSVEEREMIQRFRKDSSALFQDLNRRDTRNIEETIRRICMNHGITEEDLAKNNRMLDWEQVRRMTPLVEVGSHTVNHVNLATLDDEEVGLELRNSREIIEAQTGKEALAVSYPAGRLTPQVKRLAEEAGYRFGLGTRESVNDLRDRYELCRINIWQGSSEDERGGFSPAMFALRLSGLLPKG